MNDLTLFPVENSGLSKDITELKADPSRVLTQYEQALYRNITPQLKVMGIVSLGSLSTIGALYFLSPLASLALATIATAAFGVTLFDSQAGDMFKAYWTYRSYLKHIKKAGNQAEDYIMYFEEKVLPQLEEKSSLCKKDIRKLESKRRRVVKMGKSEYTNEAQNSDLAGLNAKLTEDIAQQNRVIRGISEQRKSLDSCVNRLRVQVEYHGLIEEESSTTPAPENTIENDLASFEESIRLVNDTYQELSLLNFKGDPGNDE